MATSHSEVHGKMSGFERECLVGESNGVIRKSIDSIFII